MIVKNFKIKFGTSINRLTDQHRYLCQEVSGMWCLYVTLPSYNGGSWNEYASKRYNLWVEIGSSEVIKGNGEIIIDLHKNND